MIWFGPAIPVVSPGPPLSDKLCKPSGPKTLPVHGNLSSLHEYYLISGTCPLFVHQLPMSFPSSTKVLVVGAGPAGMACALSAWYSGIKDVTIVDAVEQDNHSSRAMVVHAATLEVRVPNISVPFPFNHHLRLWTLFAALLL